MTFAKGAEWNLYLQLLWETGAAQTDAAILRAEDIDRQAGTISSLRYKESELIHRGPKINFWRAPTENDLNVWGDERAAIHERLRIRRGILAQADQNLLYIDEINLLNNDIVDSILDAAAQGTYTVRRGPISATYRARFILIGSMNPEEGRLRPQILDRFGLRVIVRGLVESDERLEAYRQVQAYRTNPREMIMQFADAMNAAKDEIKLARERVKQVQIPNEAARSAIGLIQKMGIDSLRAEITWFESARAYAAADDRAEVTFDDLKTVAPLALRLRRSQFIADYFETQQAEEIEVQTLLAKWGKPKPRRILKR